MELSPIQIQSNAYRQSFGTLATGLGKSASRKDLRANFTHFFRGEYNMDLHMDNIIRLTKKYKAPIKVTICGCSDGTKAIEQQMAAIKRFTERKISLDLLPEIHAFDIDNDMIKLAKNGRLNISDWEFDELQKLYPTLINDFWKGKAGLIDIPGNDIEFIEKTLNTKYRYSYQYNPELLKKINFYQGDVFEEIPKLKSDIPQIVSFENLAIHLESDMHREKAAKLLDSSLAPESIVIVGIRDRHYLGDNRNTLPNNFVKTLTNKYFAKNRNISPQECILEKQYFDPETGYYYTDRR